MYWYFHIIFWITYFLNRLYFYFSEIKDPVDFGFSHIFLPVWCTSGWHVLKRTAFDIIRLCKDNYTAIYSLQRKVPSTSETKIYRLSYQWYFVLTTWRKKCWDAFRRPGSHVIPLLDKEQLILQIPLYTSNALLCFLETHISQLKYTFTLFDRLLMVQYFGMIDFALISITFYTFLVKSYITINWYLMTVLYKRLSYRNTPWNNSESRVENPWLGPIILLIFETIVTELF